MRKEIFRIFAGLAGMGLIFGLAILLPEIMGNGVLAQALAVIMIAGLGVSAMVALYGLTRLFEQTTASGRTRDRLTFVATVLAMLGVFILFAKVTGVDTVEEWKELGSAVGGLGIIAAALLLALWGVKGAVVLIRRVF